jgi:predicted small secreted protein
MRKLLALLAMSLVVLTACNTVRGTVNGVGKDTAAAGVWIQEKVPANQ